METIVVGLISGVTGVIVAGLLQIRGRRLEQLRERQIAAADEFATAATEVFVALTARVEVLKPLAGREREWLAEFKEAANTARNDLHQTTRRLPRLELLFGVGSPTAAAADLVGHLSRMTTELQKETGDQQVVEEEYEDAAEAFGRFNKSANEILTLPLWRQWLGLGRRSAVDLSKSLVRELESPQDHSEHAEDREAMPGGS